MALGAGSEVSYPIGQCQCGCGRSTPVAERTYSSKSIVKGKPLRYLPGHRGCRRRPDGKLKCSRCKDYKTPREFTKDSRARHGRCLNCKTCVHQLASERKVQRQTSKLRYQLKTLYGLTVEQYKRMFEIQGGACAICAKPETTRRKDGTIIPLQVDHDHQTGAVRALLCQSCNQGLGHFKDDVALMSLAINYLRSHGEKEKCQV